MNVVRTLYHMLRFFVVDADIKDTLETVTIIYDGTGHEAFHAFYTTALCIGIFLAPILTMTAIMSVFKNIRAHFNFFKATGNVHVFSELNEKSAALADSILEKNNSFFRRPVIVFTDVMDPDNETQFDLQESAEEKGAICFRNDLESINYRGCLRSRKKKYCFYLINDDEAEKIRHAGFISKKYDVTDVGVYVFSDKTSCKLFLSVSDQFKYANIIRIDEIQSLIYYNLHENGVRLFETAKRVHSIDPINHKVVIRAIIIGFGRYGREMFKALLWFCQIPGYELEIHVMDCNENLEERLLQDFPELMARRKNAGGNYKGGRRGDAQYSISVRNEGIDVNTNRFSDELSKIEKPTYVFIALGNDEENIQTSIKVRELYRKMGCEPDIETVVYDSNLSDSMSSHWPSAGCLDAASLIFSDGFSNSGYRSESNPAFSKYYLALPDYFKMNLADHTAKAISKGHHNLGSIVEWGYDINIKGLYDREAYLAYRHDKNCTPEAYCSTIITEIQPDVVADPEGGNVYRELCTASVVEKKQIVQIRIRFCFYDAEKDVVTVDFVRGAVSKAFKKAQDKMMDCQDGVINFKKQPYKIHMIGDLKNFYRIDIMINDNLIKKGQIVDERWNKANRQNSKLAMNIYERLAEWAEQGYIYPRRSHNLCEVFFLKIRTDIGGKDISKELVFNPTPHALSRLLCSYTVFVRDDHNLIITDSSGTEVEDKLKAEIVLYLFRQFRSDEHAITDDDMSTQLKAIENGFGTTEISSYITQSILPFVTEFIKKMDGVNSIKKKYDHRIMVLVNDEVNDTFLDFSFPYSKDGSVCPHARCAACRALTDDPRDDGNCEKQWDEICQSIERIHKRGEEAGKNRRVSIVCDNCDSCLYKNKCQKYNRCFVRMLAKFPVAKRICLSLRQAYLRKIHQKCSYDMEVLEETISSVKTRKALCLSCDQCSSPCISYMRLKCMLDSMSIYSSRNYYRFEYNQRSSITKYMHECLRFRLLRCGYLDDELKTAFADDSFYVFDQLREHRDGVLPHKTFVHHMISAIEKDPIYVTSLNEQLAIGSIEHIRWNAYMRTEGYSFNIKRDDMAKHHNLILPLHYLYLSDIRKDV